MYKFIKLQDKKIPDLVYNYQFYCTSVIDLLKHTQIYQGIEIEKGLLNILNLDKQHVNTSWASAVLQLSKIQNKDIIQTSMKLEEKMLLGKIECLNKYGNLCLNQNGSFMFYLPDRYDIIETIEKKSMVYPDNNYTQKDIKIIKWKGGKHYYAKIGDIDVVDKEGNQRWDTRETALEKAEEFLKGLD